VKVETLFSFEHAIAVRTINRIPTFLFMNLLAGSAGVDALVRLLGVKTLMTYIAEIALR
jgi:hypothetical protein